MSPLGKFILERIGPNGALSSKTLQLAAFWILKEGTFFARYIAARQYAMKLDLAIQDPL